VSGQFLMTLVTRIPLTAAFELNRDDVALAVVMRAPRFKIDIYAANFAGHSMTRSRGQINTRMDAITQHAIIRMKPVLNDPVR
jgi:hypothetical protein